MRSEKKKEEVTLRKGKKTKEGTEEEGREKIVEKSEDKFDENANVFTQLKNCILI